jgi:histidinol dehydrogenase
VVVPSLERATELANQLAPEHVEIMTAQASRLAAKVRNAGAIFVGPYATEPLGDYVAGPNHVLPTGGTARFSSPLGVYDFLKRTSIIEVRRRGLEELAGTVVELAGREGLEAHARAVAMRVEDGD